ncbi:hypothetical protein HID58_038214 [Brassica napus]|nr:hypothetical protein HID58_038214 [Brassica napus]CAF2325359.1 unnamed protein product [Brassica napus]CAG7909911.1 unnamed protein product [Brassica rapa]VDD17490.1 unnamed protein product [Brassica rapa]
MSLKDDSVFEEKANVGGRRIKVVITRKQLDLLLAKQVSLEQLGLVKQRMFLRSSSENKWKPRLESIHETPELRTEENRGKHSRTDEPFFSLIQISND